MKKNHTGGSSQDRRRARRAAERAVQPAADPTEDFDAIAALAAGASITGPIAELGVIPDSANYGPAPDEDHACADCSFYDDGQCSKWDATVDAGYTCDSFEANPVDNDETAILELAARARGPIEELSLWDRRQAVRAALVASGDSEPALVTNYEMTNGSLAERWFVQAAIEAGYVELSGDSWPCDLETLENDEDDRVTFRNGACDAVYRLADGTVAHVTLRYGTLRIHTAAPTREAAVDVCTAFRALFPASYLIDDGDTRVPITFWTLGQYGPVPRLRKVEAAKWADIEGNYSGDLRHQIGSMMSWKEPEADGQLILWQGEPGTGKTWALRALASEWAPWAEFHYITDPDAFFIRDPSYMIDVLLSDSYGAIDIDTGDVYEETDKLGKWRVLILEDTGELLAANAKESYGQGLSRLLNVVDGMIGQGLRVLALVTTNDELGDLHPAAARPGRCAVQAEFGPLSAEEASEWLDGDEVSEPMTLAELYAYREAGVDAFAQEMPCATCDHAYDDHMGDGGACAMDGCSCKEYEAADEMAVEEEPADLVAASVPRRVSFNLVFDDETVERAASVLADGVKLERVVEGAEPHAGVSFDERLSAALSSKFADAGLGDLPVLPDAHKPAESLPAPNPSPAAPEPAAAASGFEWTALFVPEATLTDDGRAFAPGSLTWRELPLTLMGLNETGPGGHEGAIACGRIDNVWRDGNAIRATGVFSEDEVGTYFATNVGDGTIRGLSIDIAIHEYEVGPKTDYFDEEGNWRAKPEGEAEAPPERDLLDVLFGGEQEDTIFVVTDGVIGAATVCPFPAFAEANISLAASGAIWTYTHQGAFTVTDKTAAMSLFASGGFVAPVMPSFNSINSSFSISRQTTIDPEETLTASAAGLVPVHPPVDWFDDPGLAELTPITVDENGRIFGHAWAWDTCHTAFPDVCTVAPHSNAEYAYFLLKTIDCEGGEEVEVGTITLDTGHAGQRATRENAVAHYDNTGCAVADVVVGEDAFGGWVSGALRPDVDAAQARKLKGSVLSGDWRNVDGNLELVALLAVNVPGFPVPRTRALVATGIGERSEVLSLVAAGMNAALVPEWILAEIEALADVARGKFSEIARRARAA